MVVDTRRHDARSSCAPPEVFVLRHPGDVRDLNPGVAVLLEDTTGKGHVSEVTSATDFEGFAIRLE